MYIRIKCKNFKFEYKVEGIYFNLLIFNKEIKLSIENKMLGLSTLFG